MKKSPLSQLIRAHGRTLVRGLCIPGGLLAVTALVAELGAVPGVSRVAAVRPESGEIELEGTPAQQDVATALHSVRALMTELRDEGYALEVGSCVSEG